MNYITIVNKYGVKTETDCKTLSRLDKNYTILRGDKIIMGNGVVYEKIKTIFKYPVIALNEVYYSVITFWNNTDQNKSIFKAEISFHGKIKFVNITNKEATEIFSQNLIQNK